MDTRIIALLITCAAAVIAAGCTGSPAGSAAPALPATTPDVTTAPADAQGCTTGADCVPAQCCHPVSCTSRAAAVSLSCENKLCTMSCEGPLDCGAGSCGCVAGKCSVIPASPAREPAGHLSSVTLEVSPQRYSPMMSSTPGIGLTPKVTGVVAAGADFEWNASYGRFLMWDAPDFKVHDIGNPVATDGRTIYWTFTEKPAPAKDPVTITVTARDRTRRGAVLGTSTVTLGWDGDLAVYVQEIT